MVTKRGEKYQISQTVIAGSDEFNVNMLLGEGKRGCGPKYKFLQNHSRAERKRNIEG